MGSRKAHPFFKNDKIDSLKDRLDSIKEDVLEEYCFTQQDNYMTRKNPNMDDSGLFIRKSKKQPIYSISLKMTAKTMATYLKFVSVFNKNSRFGPGKAMKYLLEYYDREERRKDIYMKNILTYLKQIEVEINQNSYNPATKKLSKNLNELNRNLESYIRVISLGKDEIRKRISDKGLLSTFELFCLIQKI